MNNFDRWLTGLCLLALVMVATAQEQNGDDSGGAGALLNERCSACHQPLPDGSLSRVGQARKTPEGWDMTIVRMMLIHNVEIEAEERASLVKHLADTQGLAPAETQNWRYILERRPNAIESPEDENIAVMCARCHSYARVALQRRDEDEWRKLSHFHLGQYPTTEYQALGRDRNWWEIASTQIPAKLAEMYPFTTEAWTQWQSQDKPSPIGAWRVVGQRPGKGRYTGTATIAGSDEDGHYSITTTLNYADGSKVEGTGDAILYTGYEWRGRLIQGNEPVLQVLTVAEDGQSIGGRWFLEEADSIGAEIRMVRLGDSARILAVEPPYLKRGETANIIIHGTGLSGDVTLGEGVEVGKILYSSAAAIALQVKVAGDAANGGRSVRVGAAGASGLVTVYDRVEAVRVEPGYAIARVGGNGGPLAPVPAQFDAIAYLNGGDGQAGTDDDIRIGAMPASWTVDNAHEIAADMQDKKYAGSMQADGLFMPAGAGPNPERRYGTNNVGELAVKARVQDGESTVEGSAHLIVTVQRWNDPPIR
jgi:quinohemoprotein amine dehydrogenase